MTTLSSVRENMQKTLSLLQEQLVGFQSNISIALVESIKVSYYDQQVPIKHVASVTTQDRRISVDVFDPTVVNRVAKTLVDAGLNAYVFSKKTVCVNVPLMSGEQREKVSARIKALGEEAKIAIRNIRRSAKKSIEDDCLQEITDEFVNAIQSIVQDKVETLN